MTRDPVLTKLPKALACLVNSYDCGKLQDRLLCLGICNSALNDACMNTINKKRRFPFVVFCA